MGYIKSTCKTGWSRRCFNSHHKICINKQGHCTCPCHKPKVLTLMEERILDMKCKCGAEYKVYEHKWGYYIRCVNDKNHQKVET